MTALTAPARAAAPRTRRQHAASRRKEVAGAWTLLAPYAILLLVAGIIPIAYALWISFQQTPTLVDPTRRGFGGIDAYVTAITDFRFTRSFLDILNVLVVWMPIMIVAIVALALLIHASPGRFGAAMRFVYYIPGALGGIANLMLWVYLLNPSQSPISGFLHLLGFETIKQVLATQGSLPVVLALMLLLQGLGAWVVTVSGGLNSIPDEVLEAASLDGANAWQLAWRVKLPMIRQWIGYAALMNLAYGFQLFLEPYLLNQVASGALPSEYAPTQLSYWFAFVGSNFPAAAAMSVIIVIVTLIIGLLVVFRSGLFSKEDAS
ncbi:carbohydrate ABC transporter permease [Pseudolysinimonas sp.]|uniref:carbohydrate ABC transporter permease n=1 Tax=Pseudolysinimonas sp. TaxID=2680009 RepID=UPI003F80C0D1